MKNLLLILLLSISAFSCGEKDDVGPSKKTSVQDNAVLVTLIVKQKVAGGYVMKMDYSINGKHFYKKSTAQAIQLDTLLNKGDVVGLDISLINDMDKVVTGAYEYTLIKDSGLNRAGVICNSQNCNSYLNYTIK